MIQDGIIYNVNANCNLKNDIEKYRQGKYNFIIHIFGLVEFQATQIY